MSENPRRHRLLGQTTEQPLSNFEGLGLILVACTTQKNENFYQGFLQ